MKNLLQKDKRCRLLFRAYEHKRLVLKSLLMNPKIPFSKKLNIHRQFANLPRNSALSRVRNRCIFTGRSRGVYTEMPDLLTKELKDSVDAFAKEDCHSPIIEALAPALGPFEKRKNRPKDIDFVYGRIIRKA